MRLALDRSKELAYFCHALDYIPTVYPELTKKVNDMLKKAATMPMEKIVDAILKEYDHLTLRGTIVAVPSPLTAVETDSGTVGSYSEDLTIKT